MGGRLDRLPQRDLHPKHPLGRPEVPWCALSPLLSLNSCLISFLELNTYIPNSEIDRNRLSKTFIATQTSMQLMQYNVYFLEHIGRPKGKSLPFIPI